MEIFYDGAIYSIQQYGGINRYFYNLIQNLSTGWTAKLVVAELPQSLPEHPNLSVPCVRSANSKWQLKAIRKSLEGWKCRRQLKLSQATLIHPTYYWTLSRDGYRNSRLPLVLTVHDFTHERFQSEMKHTAKQIAWKREAIQRADRIVCVSQSTLNDLAEFYPGTEAKAKVVHLGCDFQPAEENASSHESTDSQGEYFLFVGGRASYKNFDVMIRALQIVVRQCPQVELKCVGAPWTSAEQAAIAQAGLGDHVINMGRVSDQVLQQLYSNSLAFVYPSKYEGFGIPLLEAMRCGCPVIASNRSSFPEVLGGSGILFEPDDQAELADAMIEVAKRGAMRDNLVQGGLARAVEFSWTKMAKETEHIYQTLV